jgi:serine/threonine protein kinase
MDAAAAQKLADFLTPMLNFDPSKRATAAEMLDSP